MSTNAEYPPQSQPAPAPEGMHLTDYVAIVTSRWRIVAAVFVACVVVATARTVLTPSVYEATAQLLIERSDPTVLGFRNVTEERYGFGIDDYYQTQYKLLQSRTLAQRVIEQLALLNEKEYGGPRSPEQIKAIFDQPPGQSRVLEGATDSFLGRLRIQPIRNARLVLVSMESGRPELAAAEANALVSLYIQQSLELRSRTSAEAGQWLTTQIAEQRVKVEQLELGLQKAKEKAGVVNIDERRSLLEQKLQQLGNSYNDIRTRRLQQEALWRQLANAPAPEEMPEVMRNPLVQSQRIELATLERQLAQLLEKYMDEHPEVVKVRSVIEETQAKIKSEARRVVRAAENEYKTSAAQEASVAAALEAAKNEALELSRKGISYDSLRREVDAAKMVLNGVMARAKETDVASELKSTNIRIVDRAGVPKGPVRPRRIRDIQLGALVGAFLGIGLAFLLDYLDSTIKTPEDVRNDLGLPLLGIVAEQHSPVEKLLAIDASHASPFTESYRILRTALGYSWPDRHPRAVLITSTAPGEGKTVTAVNIALMLASLDRRVLLVDADMRKPQAHALLQAQRTPGLSEILVGKAKPSEAIQQELAGTKLSFLSAGSRVPSPADLLTSRSLPGLLDGLRKLYDWIIIDSPPVGVVTEPSLLAPLVDGVVIVVGAEMMPRQDVQRTVERIADTRARILGVVLNRATVTRRSYYYARYYDHSAYFRREGKGHEGGGGGLRVVPPVKVARLSARGAHGHR